MVFACITDSDNQGKVPSGSIIDRDNLASLSLIITDNQTFFTTSLRTFPILTMIHRTKQMTESKSNVIFEVPTRLHRDFLVSWLREIRQVFSGQWRENVEEKKTVKEAVADRSEDQHHRLRTQSVLTRRPPHPVRLTGALKQKLPVLIWLKGQQWMLWESRRPTLIRSGMYLRRRKMVQYNGFPSRLSELVRIFTARLMMTRWRRLCIGSVERVW